MGYYTIIDVVSGSQALSSNRLMSKFTPDVNKMQFQLRTACDKMSFPLLEAERMWQSPLFNTSKGVVILATGWTTTVNETEAIDDFAQAYNCRGDVNFVVSAVWGNLRWEENTFRRF